MKQKTIIITGAGSGLGRSIAQFYAKKGWLVGCTDRELKLAQDTLDSIKESGGSGFACKCDVTVDSDYAALAELASSTWGRVDVFVNNAGAAALGTVENISMDDWEWMIDLNLKGVIRGCKTFIPIMSKNKSGHIVNIASAAGVASLPGLSPYNVTKAGVISLSETLRGEIANRGIGVSVVIPTFFKTNLTSSFRAPDEASLAKAQKFTQKAMNRSRFTAEDVSSSIYEGVKKNKLYIIPDFQAKAAYFLKRLAPNFFLKQSSRGTPDLD